jgi:hypothetical protein
MAYQQSDRVMRLRKIARELDDADWPDEEKTNPVIVQVMGAQSMTIEKPKDGTIAEGAEGAAKIVGAVKSWMQVAALGIIAISVVAVAVAYLLTHSP